jgi:hypothetical protein
MTVASKDNVDMAISGPILDRIATISGAISS